MHMDQVIGQLTDIMYRCNVSKLWCTGILTLSCMQCPLNALYICIIF